MKKSTHIRNRKRITTMRIDELRPAAQPGWYKRLRQLIDKTTRPDLH